MCERCARIASSRARVSLGATDDGKINFNEIAFLRRDGESVFIRPGVKRTPTINKRESDLKIPLE